MNTFDSSATTPTGPSNAAGAQDIKSSSSRSPTHADSGLPSSAGSSRSHSSFSSRKYAGLQNNKPSTESTPINTAAAASTRNYQATAPANSQGGPTESSKWDQSTPRLDGGPIAPNRTQGHQPDSPTEPHQSWHSRFVDRFGALELENKGSVARDHLALERTFLAWMRTSLAFASIGIAVTQLFRLNTATAVTDTNSVHNSAILPPLIARSTYDVATAPSSQDSARLRSVGKPLGSTFIGVAILILIVGFHRYFESQYWIVRGKFPASRGSVALTAAVAMALIVAAFAVILAVSPGAIET